MKKEKVFKMVEKKGKSGINTVGKRFKMLQEMEGWQEREK